MPVFEGLLPDEHDEMIQDMLFTLCTWHAYAKLRLHTTSTLNRLKAMTKALGKCLWTFSTKVCTQYETKELPREEAARVRRQANAAKKGKSKQTRSNPRGMDSDSTSRCQKLFNMLTYKLHALGDYVAAIWMFGPSSSYSTQIVSSIIFSVQITPFSF